MSCYFHFILVPLGAEFCGEYNVISLYFMCYSANGSICLVCCVLDSVCELFGKTFAICFCVVVILLLNLLLLLVRCC